MKLTPNLETIIKWIPLINHFGMNATLAQCIANGTPIIRTDKKTGERHQCTPYEVQNLWINQWFAHVCLGIGLLMLSNVALTIAVAIMAARLTK